jgi:hypothetical protein
MAWDSSATMQMTSAYQGMYSQQMGYAQQLSAMGPYSPYQGNPGMYGNQAMLSGMRGAGHVASGAMTLGSIGMGMAGMSAGMGMLGATGVGIPLAAAGMAVQYAGGQMMHGAEQQNMLNMGLRANYGFRNGQGGTGFTTGQMGQIGSQLREMSHQFGPGGEITSFNELSSLASKMGQMNMAQGVRDVQTFTKKFKEMTDALKTMAKDLGTTMEGAMEFANQAKQSGVFGMKNQAGFTSLARNMAVSGGLAMSEVTSMASIGSQISRSIGGLGSQGAIGGMRTIGQVGTAMQMGVLSEEDIYNSTGLTGAEGRQAFAASNMSRTANFLKSGRGRRMISSMADKNGQLDEGALEQFMSGGMGVEQTMGNWAGRKDKIGRANFIRNEGRLRGQILEKIGGFGDAMQMMQWAQSKGIDINDMDDRSMLFAQRQLGMGRDEADQAIKMAQNMPGILARQQTDASSDKVFQRIAQRRKTQGIEGIKNRFDQARETVNGHLEKMGQDIFNEGSEQIEAFLNKLAGVYVEAQTSDLAKLDADIRAGGRRGLNARRRGLGEGGHLNMGKSKLAFGSGGGSFEAFKAGVDGDFASNLSKDMGFGGVGRGNALGFLLHGESDMSKMKRAGFDFSDISGPGADKELARRLGVVDAQRAAAADPGNKFKGIGAGNDWVDKAYAMDKVKGSGQDRIASFGSMVEQSGSSELKKKWATATAEEKAAIMATVEREHGISGEQSLASQMAGPDVGLKGQLAGLKANSQDERSKLIGQALGTTGGPTTGQKALGAGLSAMVPMGLGALFKDKITDMVSGDALARQKKQGAIMDSNEYKDTLSDVYANDADTRRSGRMALMDKMKNMKTGDEKAVYQELLGLSEYADWVAQNPKASSEEREAKAKELTGKSASEAGSKIGTQMGLLDERTGVNQKQARERNKQIAGDSLKRMSARGLIGEDGKLRALSEKEAGGLGAAGQEYLQSLISSEQDMAKTGNYMSAAQMDARSSSLANMTMDQRKKLASMAGGSTAAAAAQMNAIEKSLGRSQKRGRGAMGGLTDALGLKYAKGDLEGLSYEQIAGDLGLGGDANVQKILAGAESDLRMGKKGDAIKKLSEVKGLADEKTAQDERKKKEEQERDSPTFKVMEKVEKHLDDIKGFSKSSANHLQNINQKTKGDETVSG